MDPYVVALAIALSLTWCALLANTIHAAAVRAETERILRRLHDRDQMLLATCATPSRGSPC